MTSPKPFFCTDACREGFTEDRAHGLSYGPNYYLDDEGETQLARDRETWSYLTESCAYCGEDINSQKINLVETGRILDLLADACSRYRREGDPGISWTFHNCMDSTERLAFDLFLVRMNDPLAFEAGTPESRFRKRIRRMVDAG